MFVIPGFRKKEEDYYLNKILKVNMTITVHLLRDILSAFNREKTQNELVIQYTEISESFQTRTISWRGEVVPTCTNSPILQNMVIGSPGQLFY